MKRFIPAIVVGLGLSIGAIEGHGAVPSELLWHHEDEPGTVFALASRGSSAFAAGLLEAAGPNFSDWHVQAYDPRNGELLWQDTYDRALRPDAALAVTAGQQRVAAGGYVRVPGPGGNFNWFVRAYDAASGAVLWDDEIDGSPRDRVSDVEIAGGIVVAAGTVGDETCVEQGFGDCDFVVIAYDAETGAVRWQSRHDANDQYDEAASLAVSGNRVYVAGSVGDADGLPDMLLHAYDLQSGALLWSSTFDSAGLFDIGGSVAVSGATVVIGGFGGANCLLFEEEPDCDAIVRAYKATTGELLWHFQHDEAESFDEVISLVAGSAAAFGAGRVSDAAGAHLATFALDLSSGELMWQDVVNLDAGESSVARGATLQGTSLIVAGGGGAGCVGEPISNCDVIVRAYDAKTGELRWWDRHDEAGGDDTGNAVVIHGLRVLVGGSLAPGFGQPTPWAVRAYRNLR